MDKYGQERDLLMVEINKLLRKLFATGIIWVYTILVVIAFGYMHLMSNYGQDISSVNRYIIVAILTLIGSYATVAIISARIELALNYLVSTIYYASTENPTIEAPSPMKLPKSYSSILGLADRVYDLSGTKTTTGSTVPNLNELATPAIGLDSDDNIVFINAAAAAYLNIKQAEVNNTYVYDVLKLMFSSKLTLEDWIKDCRQTKVTAEQSWERVRHTLGDDSMRQFDLVARFNRDAADGLEVTLVIFDHTAKYTQEDRDIEFVSIAVHELRTPLTIMRGYIEVFQDELTDKLNQEQQEFMSNMSAQAQQLASFVSNILNVARIEENQLHLHLKQESWPEILRQVVNDMDARARVRGISINLSIPEGLPDVAVDKVTTYEVLVNLLDNAIKYTHNQSPINVSVKQLDQQWIETTITDQGVGIPDSVVGNLFQKFYRSHRSKQSTLGTGLGLFISKAIVNAHGGEIWVKSKEGMGSTFGFTVPTHESLATQLNSDNNEITREAHGWIKNHSMYRG